MGSRFLRDYMKYPTLKQSVIPTITIIVLAWIWYFIHN